MSIEQVDLGAIGEIDGGKVSVVFARHLKRAAEDCMDRPGEPKARKVTLTVHIEPVMTADGDCDEVRAVAKVSSNIPDHQTKPYSFGLRRNGVMVFNPSSPTNVHQGTFDLDEEDQ